MAGNVWEWTEDWFGPYPTSAATNPRGAETGAGRVVRGGGWGDTDAGNVRAADRTVHAPSDRHMNVGFRCARGD
jgi:formylglycine-generating enzyme required for sulfatase activity